MPRKPVTLSEEEDAQEGQGNDDGDSGSAEWADDSDDDDSEEGTPSYEFRFECAKMLLELDDSTEAAIQVGTWLLMPGGNALRL
jgi:hypothetical protein